MKPSINVPENLVAGGCRVKRMRSVDLCVLAVLANVGCGGESPDPARFDSLAPRSGPNKTESENEDHEYIALCEDRGIEIPETVLDLEDGWKINGVLNETFIHTQLQAELWSFQGDNGSFCLALPRQAGSASEIEVLGMICMSRAGETCFFTADGEQTLNSPGPTISIDSLMGGDNLIGNEEGVCADCHAGANPFVVHPNDPAFVNAAAQVGGFMPTHWPQLNIPDHPDWPPNPDPLETLPPTTGQSCDAFACHSAGGVAGQLPLLSPDHPGYCNGVLRSAVGENPDPDAANTMPPGDPDGIDAYDAHRDWLLGLCDTAPGEGQVVRFEPPPGPAVLPPWVDAPYACTRFVTVNSTLVGATVIVTVLEDGEPPATIVGQANEIGPNTFELNDKLVEGAEVRVRQILNGVSSEWSYATVRDHFNEFPDGLPPPLISPEPLYECGHSLGITNVPGATIRVTKNESTGKTWHRAWESGYSRTWGVMKDGGPFDIGDTFSVTQQICDDTSESSDVAEVVGAPGSLPPVVIDPPVDGQQFLTLRHIVQGAGVLLTEHPDLVLLQKGSFPFNRYTNIDLKDTPLGPTTGGDQLVAQQSLCDQESSTKHSVAVQDCEPTTLVPEIIPPRVGDDFIIATELVPGATVRVFASEGGITEIGSATGPLVALTRSLKAGETIIVTGSFPTCEATRGFSIVVGG